MFNFRLAILFLLAALSSADYISALEPSYLNGKNLTADIFGTPRVLFVFSNDGKTVTATPKKRPHTILNFTQNIGDVAIYQTIGKNGKTVYMSFYVMDENHVITTHGHNLDELTEAVLIKKMQGNPKLSIDYSS